MMNVIFVCTGNTCRSPMAEYYLKSKNLENVNIISRGFSFGESVNSKSVAVMKELGIDISNHESKLITADDINPDCILLCMEQSHKQLLLSIGSNPKNTSVLGGGIPDPFGFDTDTYRRCRDKIVSAIDNLISIGFFSEVTLSDATVDDIADIANIEKECFSIPWSENAIRDSMNAGTNFYTAKIAGNTVGYMGLSKIMGEGYVTNIAVLPDYRNRGIGKKILEYAIENSKKELEFISLEVRPSNSYAISLYKSLGFEQVGIRKRFYTNPQEDALIMTKNFF